MSNWQAGDLALCVNVSDRHYANLTGAAGRKLRKGAFYTVVGTGVSMVGNLTLHLAELSGHPMSDEAAAWRFVKITPPAADAFDREVIDLTLGKPEPVK